MLSSRTSRASSICLMAMGLEPGLAARAETDQLKDGFNRVIDYLRVSVTDRCDMRCAYCMPKAFKGFQEPANWLSHQETGRLVNLFVGLGISKVRLTGGEPLLRRNLPDLVRNLSSLPGLTDLSLSTNGAHLVAHAPALKAAGLHRLNVSLDTLKPAKFHEITHRDCLEDVLAGIQLVLALGFSPIKINMVVQAGVNDDEVDDMLQFAVEHGLVLRLIETMPIGHAGLGKTAVDLTALTRRLVEKHRLIPYIEPARTGPAQNWRVPNSSAMLGVITPMSQHFCAACNRLRLGVDGTLYPCLGHNDATPLGRMMRRGASDAELIEAILSAVAHKPERHEFHERPERVVRFMSVTGG